MWIDASAQRAIIWISILGAIIYGNAYVFLTGLFPPPTPMLDVAQVAALYTDQNLQLRVGVVICIIAGGFNLPWSLAVGLQMARYERGIPVWSILQVLAGTLGTILFMAPPLFWGVAAFTAERNPEITMLMHELAFLTLVTPTSFFGLQALPIAVIGIAKGASVHGAFPRWMGYASAWMLATAELGVVAQLFKEGPFAWNGAFTFWLPLSAFTVWFGVICYTMFSAIKQQEQAKAAAV